jgi:hypothetical protein
MCPRAQGNSLVMSQSLEVSLEAGVEVTGLWHFSASESFPSPGHKERSQHTAPLLGALPGHAAPLFVQIHHADMKC